MSRTTLHMGTSPWVAFGDHRNLRVIVMVDFAMSTSRTMMLRRASRSRLAKTPRERGQFIIGAEARGVSLMPDDQPPVLSISDAAFKKAASSASVSG